MAVVDLVDLGYPETTCFLPLLLRECRVRCFTVAEISKIKTSSNFSVSLINAINELIYRCIVDKPEGLFSDYDSFIKTVPTRDRDALLYSILEASEALEQIFPVTCPKCSTTQEMQINLADCFDAKFFEAQEEQSESEENKQESNTPLILTKREKVEITTPKAIINFYLGVPTLDREKRTMAYIGQRNIDASLLTLLLVTQKVEVYRADEPTELVGAINKNDFDSLETLIRRLRIQHCKQLENHYAETLGQYGITLFYSYTCNNCGYSQKRMPIDLIQWFFQYIFA